MSRDASNILKKLIKRTFFQTLLTKQIVGLCRSLSLPFANDSFLKQIIFFEHNLRPLFVNNLPYQATFRRFRFSTLFLAEAAIVLEAG